MFEAEGAFRLVLASEEGQDMGQVSDRPFVTILFQAGLIESGLIKSDDFLGDSK